MKSSFLVLFPIVFLVAACTNTNRVITEAASKTFTATVTVTTTPIPSTTATVTETFAPTFTSTPTIQAVILTPILDQSHVIDESNVDQLTEMAQWGNGQLYSLRLSSNGKKIIAVFSTGVRVFDAENLVELSRVETPIDNEYSVGWDISPNGEKLIVLDKNARLTMWQLTNGKMLSSIFLDRDNDLGCAMGPGDIFFDTGDFVFSPDNNSIGIFGFCDGWIPSSRLLLIRTSDLKILIRLEGFGEGLFSPDGKYLAVYSEGNTDNTHPVKLFRTEDGLLLHTFENYKPIGCPKSIKDKGENPWSPTALWGDLISCVAFSPDSQKLAVGYYDATRLYNLTDGTEAGSFTAGRPWFSVDGRLLWIDSVTQSSGIDSSSNKHVNLPSTLFYPLISPAGTYITGMSRLASYEISGSSLWNLIAGKSIVQFKGYSRSVFSADDNYVAFSSFWTEEKPVLLVQTSGEKLLQTLRNETSPIFLADGKSLLTVSGNSIIVRKLPGGEINFIITNAAWPQPLLDGESLITLEGNYLTRRRISDGEVLATQPFPVSPDNIIPAGMNIIETSVSGNRLLSLPKLTYQQEFGAATILSPDGTYYAISLLDSVEMWQTNDPSKPVYTIPTGGQNRVDFSPDGDLIGIDKMNGDIEVRNVQTGDLIQILKIGISKHIDQLIFSPDQHRLYIIADQNRRYTLMGWKLTDGATLPFDSVKYDGPITISQDSKYLAFVREPGKITVVQIAGWMPTHTLDNEEVLIYGEGIERLAFSPNGVLLAMITSNGGIHVWELSTDTLVRTILPPRYNEYNSNYTRKNQFGVTISFSPDGRFLLSSTGGVARIWGVP